MKTTNIYFLIDCSAFMGIRAREKAMQAVRQANRALKLSKAKTALHIIGYNDKAFLLDTDKPFPMKGNANLTEGLKLLESIIRYQREYNDNQTQSIFLWYTSGKSLIGYEKQIEKLFGQKEFAFGLKYAIINHSPTCPEKKRLETFTENSSRILYHFSQSRLTSLVKNLSLNKNRRQPK